MSKFYGSVRDEYATTSTATRTAHRGIRAAAQSWNGSLIAVAEDVDGVTRFSLEASTTDSTMYGSTIWEGTLEDLIEKLKPRAGVSTGMSWGDYLEAVKTDALETIENEHESYDTFEEMHDALFVDDSVTGNGSGSYTMNAMRAAENVAGIVFDDDALEAFRDAGYEGIPTERGAEACDVIARCLALDYVADELEEHFDELKDSEE